MRSLLRLVPSPPRCEWCEVPFAGPFVPLFTAIGKGRFSKNPRFCSGCFLTIGRRRGGAEVPCTAVFADVRGSTGLSERLGPARLHQVMDRFYEVGVAALVEGGALVDRFLGDEIVGYFVPGFAGPDHARRAVDTGLAILSATGNVPEAEPWIPVGIGINTGRAFVGNLGAGGQLSILTALGEDVNVAARLASSAGQGEILIGAATRAAALPTAGEQRELTLKGVSGPVTAFAVRPTSRLDHA